MILYHFTTSPFAQRVRLAIAHKGLSVELRDSRANPSFDQDVKRLNPAHTVPVLVDGERVLTDSTAMLHYLDRKHPDPPLWPAGLAGAHVFDLLASIDTSLTLLVDLGLRYHPLHADPSFPRVRETMVGRAQRSLDRLAAVVSARGPGAPLCGDSWSAADMALYPAVAWLEGLPARAVKAPGAKQVLELGWSLPPALATWAAQRRTRPDVIALG